MEGARSANTTQQSRGSIITPYHVNRFISRNTISLNCIATLYVELLSFLNVRVMRALLTPEKCYMFSSISLKVYDAARMSYEIVAAVTNVSASFLWIISNGTSVWLHIVSSFT